jgi:DNA adenine methylase
MQTSKQRGPLAWVGGKSQLRKEIVPMIPEDHKTYVEVFAGGAWVLFGKEPSKVEIINDINGELVNFWRVVKQRPQAFVAELQYLVSSREIFSVLKSVDTCYLSEVVRSCRFFYLNKNSFGAKGKTFAAGPLHKHRLNYDRLDEIISDVWQRLQTVKIEQLDYKKLIKRYDRKETFFYIDPPYVDCPGCYEHEFDEKDHKDLAKALSNIKGRFILSYNNHPVIQKLYKKFNQKKVNVKYSLNDKGSTEATELIICNFALA